MLVDSDRIIKMANLYTDESVGTLKKSVEGEVKEAFYKITKLDSQVDEELDKIRRIKVSREEI